MRRIERAQPGQIEHRTEVYEERIVTLASEHFHSIRRVRVSRLPQSAVVRHRAGPTLTGGVAVRAERLRSPGRLIPDPWTLYVCGRFQSGCEAAIGPGCCEEGVWVADLGVEAELIRDVVSHCRRCRHGFRRGRSSKPWKFGPPAGFERDVWEVVTVSGWIGTDERVDIGVVGLGSLLMSGASRWLDASPENVGKAASSATTTGPKTSVFLTADPPCCIALRTGAVVGLPRVRQVGNGGRTRVGLAGVAGRMTEPDSLWKPASG